MIIPQYTERIALLVNYFWSVTFILLLVTILWGIQFSFHGLNIKLKQASYTKKHNDKTFKTTGACFIPQEAGAHDKKF